MNQRQKISGINVKPTVGLPKSSTGTKRTPSGEKSLVSNKTSEQDGSKSRKLSDDKSSSGSVKSSSSSIDNTELHISEDKLLVSTPKKGLQVVEQKPKETNVEDKTSAFLIKKRSSLRKTEGTSERSYIPRKSNSFRSDDFNGVTEKFKTTSVVRKASLEKTSKSDVQSKTVTNGQTGADKSSVTNGQTGADKSTVVKSQNVVLIDAADKTEISPDSEKSAEAVVELSARAVPELESLVSSDEVFLDKTDFRHTVSQSVHSPTGEIGTQTILFDKPKYTCPEQPGYVGFANLPNQVHRKSVKKGFEFTLMVVGESGLGKSTLVNSLFLTDLYPERLIHSAAEKIKQTVKIDASTVEIEERGVKLRLTVVDTPGFGDSLNSVDCFKPIIQYVDDQFERYLQDESGLNRRHIIDNRVHCCFYFINPSGHGLRPLDIAFMKAVHHKVNIVPVIAKADTLTKQEVQRLKRRILDQIDEYGISIYPLPDCDSDEDEDYREQCRQLKEAVPFAVIGANTVIEVKGRKVRGRMYPWGVVEVENPEHCDFIKLRTMLITHMQDLQEVTQEVHYENFRADKLANGGSGGGGASMKKVRRQREEAYEQDKNRRPDSMINDEKEKQLAEKDAELRKMQEMLARMQAEMEAQKRMAGGTPGKQNGGIKSENV